MNKKNNNLKDIIIPKLPYFIFILVIVIIFAGVYIHDEIAVQRNLDEHFGNVHLSDEEIESLAKSIVDSSSDSFDSNYYDNSFEIPYKNGLVDWDNLESNLPLLSVDEVSNQSAPSNQYVLVNGIIDNIAESSFNLSIPRNESFYRIVGWSYDSNLLDVASGFNCISNGDFVEICCKTGSHGQISYSDGVLAIRKINSESNSDNENGVSDESNINYENASSDKSDSSCIDDSAVGINDKSISGIYINYKGSVNNDVTGNWRYALYNSDISQETIAVDYCNTYFKSDKELHALINKSNNTVACIQYITSDLLDVTIHEYSRGEELDANELFCGNVIAEYFVTISTGEIEDAIDE